MTFVAVLALLLTPLPDSIRLELVLPDTVRAGEAVSIALRVTNTGAAPIALHLHGRPPAFDLHVRDANGTRVWRRLEGRILPAILQVRMLAPGESFTLSDDWSPRDSAGSAVPPGRYTVEGFLLCADAPDLGPATASLVITTPPPGP